MSLSVFARRGRRKTMLLEIGYAKFNRSHDHVIRVYDSAGNVFEAYEHAAISKSRDLCARQGAKSRRAVKRDWANC